jgi:Cu2+-exporting ATPase
MIAGGAVLLMASGLYGGARMAGLLPAKKNSATLISRLSHQSVMAIDPAGEDQNLVVLSEAEVQEAEREALDHYFKISTGVVGAGTAAMIVFPPLHVLAIPALIYTLVPMFMDAYEGMQLQMLRPSLVDSIAVTGAIGLGLANHLNPYFFMAGAVGTWLYFLSAKLVLRTKDKSIQSLSNLFGEQARFVWLLRDGVEVEVPFENVQIGDVVVVSAGEMIPVDGKVIKGIGSVDQRMLTGEAQPVEKGCGEDVYAATTLLTGAIHIQVLKAGADAVAAQIGEIWSRTADYRTTVETRSEQLSNKSVLPTLGTGLLALLTLGPIGATAILLSNFSDAVQLAAPLSTLNFLHLASKTGILIKDGRALEGLRQVDTIVFDKTGTLTLEQPHVGELYLYADFDEQTLLTYAAAAEVKQSHPVAKAILQAAKERELELPPLNEAAYQVGYGIKAEIDGHVVCVGSGRFMESEGISMPTSVQQDLAANHAKGHTLIMVGIDGRIAGSIALKPTIRPEAQELVRRLHARNLELCIISGDHLLPTKALADELGIDRFFAETLPEDKASLIAELQQQGRKVCFIGDGINDTIALKQANVSISLSGAASAAQDTAQIIMMDGSLKHLDHMFELSRQFDENLHTSFRTVIGGSCICVGGVFLFHFGIFSALALQTLTLLASVANAFLPILKDNLDAPKLDGPKQPTLVDKLKMAAT